MDYVKEFRISTSAEIPEGQGSIGQAWRAKDMVYNGSFAMLLNSDSSKFEIKTVLNLNVNQIMYSSLSNVPDIFVSDSICYYSERIGLGFSKATTNLVSYFDSIAGNSTGFPVSIIKTLTTSPALRSAWRSLLVCCAAQKIGYSCSRT